MNRIYICMGAILIIVGVIMTTYPLTRMIDQPLFPLQDIDLHTRSGRIIEDTNFKEKFRISGVILIIMGITVGFIGTLTPPTKQKDKMDIVMELISSYSKKGYEVIDYKIGDSVLKLIILKRAKNI